MRDFYFILLDNDGTLHEVQATYDRLFNRYTGQFRPKPDTENVFVAYKFIRRKDQKLLVQGPLEPRKVYHQNVYNIVVPAPENAQRF